MMLYECYSIGRIAAFIAGSLLEFNDTFNTIQIISRL